MCLKMLLVSVWSLIFVLFFLSSVIVTEKTNILLRYLHQQWDKKASVCRALSCMVMEKLTNFITDMITGAWAEQPVTHTSRRNGKRNHPIDSQWINSMFFFYLVYRLIKIKPINISATGSSTLRTAVYDAVGSGGERSKCFHFWKRNILVERIF